jgi:NAD(P)-dependent dehydrogenase (short-subunit alcohol dehydrogenase family)
MRPKELLLDRRQAAAIRKIHPRTLQLAKLGTADELASVAVFLAADEGSFITGIDLPLDGGTVSS